MDAETGPLEVNQTRHRLKLAIVAVGIVGVIVATASVRYLRTNPRVGTKIDDFSLLDWRGKPVSLRDFPEPIVVAFLGTECPLARIYGTRLQKLADQPSKEVRDGRQTWDEMMNGYCILAVDRD